MGLEERTISSNAYSGFTSVGQNLTVISSKHQLLFIDLTAVPG